MIPFPKYNPDQLLDLETVLECLGHIAGRKHEMRFIDELARDVLNKVDPKWDAIALGKKYRKIEEESLGVCKAFLSKELGLFQDPQNPSSLEVEMFYKRGVGSGRLMAEDLNNTHLHLYKIYDARHVLYQSILPRLCFHERSVLAQQGESNPRIDSAVELWDKITAFARPEEQDTFLAIRRSVEVIREQAAAKSPVVVVAAPAAGVSRVEKSFQLEISPSGRTN